MNQSLFASLYRNWIWIGPPFVLGSAAALIYLIACVVSTVRQAMLFKVPLAGQQEVQFGEAGRVVLSTEGPRLSRRFASIGFELRGVDGDPVQKRRVLFRARTSGISTVRTEEFIFDVPRPGRYLLTMTGLAETRDTRVAHNVVFMRPHLRQVLAFVAGIAVASALLIVSLVFFLLRLLDTTDFHR